MLTRVLKHLNALLLCINCLCLLKVIKDIVSFISFTAALFELSSSFFPVKRICAKKEKPRVINTVNDLA